MDFNTKGHEAKEKGDYVSGYIKPGISVAKITEIVYHQSRGGTEGFKIIHTGKPMEALDGKGQIAETTLWASPKAWEFTKDKFCIMADKLGVREALDAIQANNAEEYAAGLNSVFASTGAARWKFIGEEIEGKFDEASGNKKNNWFKASMGMFGFVELLTVSEEESELKFDENDKWDMKRLAPSDIESDAPFNEPDTKVTVDDWS
jgi:hypothetical protein